MHPPNWLKKFNAFVVIANNKAVIYFGRRIISIIFIEALYMDTENILSRRRTRKMKQDQKYVAI